MPTDLERDLGLYAVITISVGAMIGSGIFVLPGLAFKIAGPAVILAYFLAGIVVLPAALSKAEMATAMPEAGGTYLYIDRAMGPFFGTIAGIGAWFSLTFKSAFALVGLGAYLVLFSGLPPMPVALSLAVGLIGLNVVGVKQTGRLQAAIVTAVLAALVFFIANGLTFVNSARYHPFFGTGGGDLIAATGFVFVSYAGVTKIASVAEEVENPSRNIPIGMLGSVIFMMLVYTLVVFVVVGVTPADRLAATLTPMADAASQVLGPVGFAIIAGVAVLALVSMANAGVLSASRFPFAMSRDALAPPELEHIHERFSTPYIAIIVTGTVLVLLVAFVPVLELAKLASAFKILVFSLVNVALIAFRESGLDTYDPTFRSPGYPWVQLFGIGGGVVLLTQMGTLPIVGAVAIILAGVIWYRIYGRAKTEREGAALDAIRRRADRRSLDRTQTDLTEGGSYNVLLPIREGISEEREATLLGIAANLVHRRGGRVQVIQFERVPEQTPLQALVAEQSPQELSFEQYTHELAEELSVPVEVGEIATHDVNRAIANFVKHENIDVIIASWEAGDDHGWPFGSDVDWLMEHVSSDVVFVEDRGVTEIDEIAVIADTGPYDPLKVRVADAIATEVGATLRFLQAVDSSASDAQLNSIREYHTGLDELCSAHTESEILQTDEIDAALVDAASGADIAVIGVSSHRHLSDVLFGSLQDHLIGESDNTVILVHSAAPRRHTFLRGILERLLYSR